MSVESAESPALCKAVIQRLRNAAFALELWHDAYFPVQGTNPSHITERMSVITTRLGSVLDTVVDKRHCLLSFDGLLCGVSHEIFTGRLHFHVPIKLNARKSLILRMTSVFVPTGRHPDRKTVLNNDQNQRSNVTLKWITQTLVQYYQLHRIGYSVRSIIIKNILYLIKSQMWKRFYLYWLQKKGQCLSLIITICRLFKFSKK